MAERPDMNAPAKSTGAGDVQARFSAAAATYEGVADLHRDVARDLMRLLPEHATPRSILEPGCGTGVLTQRLAQRFPDAVIDAFDIAPAMIDEARRRHGHLRNVSWRVHDFMAPQKGPARYDALISSAALHWAPSLNAALVSLAPSLAREALVHVALMLDGTLGELHRSRAAVAPQKSALQAMPAFDAVYASFEQMGWTCLHSGPRRYVAVLPDAAAVLQQVHRQGVTAGSISRGSNPLTRSELQRLKNHYDSHYAVEGGVSITSEVGFFSFIGAS